MNSSLTVDQDIDRVFQEVGAIYHHASEGSLVHQGAMSDEETGVCCDAHSVLVTVCGLDRCLILVSLLDQEVPGDAIFLLIHPRSTGTTVLDYHFTLHSHHTL